MAQTANLYTPLFKKLDIFPRRQSVWFPFVKYHYPNMTASEVNTGLVLFCFDYFRQITQLIGKKKHEADQLSVFIRIQNLVWSMK